MFVFLLWGEILANLLFDDFPSSSEVGQDFGLRSTFSEGRVSLRKVLGVYRPITKLRAVQFVREIKRRLRYLLGL